MGKKEEGIKERREKRMRRRETLLWLSIRPWRLLSYHQHLMSKTLTFHYHALQSLPSFTRTEINVIKAFSSSGTYTPLSQGPLSPLLPLEPCQHSPFFLVTGISNAWAILGILTDVKGLLTSLSALTHFLRSLCVVYTCPCVVECCVSSVVCVAWLTWNIAWAPSP